MVKVRNKDKIKIGARVLSDEQLEKLLPNSKEIYYRIEVIRTHANELRKREISYENTYKKYLAKELDRNSNNVFSILGGRGSGKTSVLLTIKNHLTNKSNVDIMLPLIVPENMGEYSDVLGWTICSFEKIIEEIEKYVYRYKNENNIAYDFFKNCRKNENNQLKVKFSELLKYYTWINEDYRKILNNTYDGLNDYKQKTKDVVNAERELLNKFEEFIDVLINVKKDISENDDVEPLIYIFFDDVDLSSERCLEIANIILKYLSMPNIVVFVAGDYATFSETLTINLLSKDGVLKNTNEIFYQRKNTETKDNTVLEVRKTLAQDILKKVLPPAYRFHMPILSNEYKAEFVYLNQEDENDTEEIKFKKNEEDDEDSEYDSLAELISRKLMLIKKSEHKTSFMYYNEELIEIYFNIFDSNPRGLINVYYFLYGLKKKSINPTEKDKSTDREEKDKKYCETLKKFLNVIIDSNYKLEAIRDEINHVINIKRTLSETFIDYEYIRNLYLNELDMNNYSKEKLNEENLEKYINIFMIAHFIENLVVYRMNFDGAYRKPHGIEVFTEMVNLFNRNDLLPKYNDSSKFVLALYSKIRNKLTRLRKDKLEGYKVNHFTKLYIDILYDLLGENINGKFIGEIIKIMRNDYKWVKDKIDIICKATCKNEVFLIKAINELENIQINGTEKFNISEFCNVFIGEIKKELKEIKDKYSDISEEKLLKLLNLYQFVIKKQRNNIQSDNEYFNNIYKLINESNGNNEILINHICDLLGNKSNINQRTNIRKEVERILIRCDRYYNGRNYYSNNGVYEINIDNLIEYKYVNEELLLYVFDELDYNRYRIPKLFKKKFSRIYNDIKRSMILEQTKKNNDTNEELKKNNEDKIREIENFNLLNEFMNINKIVENNIDINQEEYSIIKNSLAMIIDYSYGRSLTNECEDLYQMINDFKLALAPKNQENFDLIEFKFLIKENILLRACIDITKMRKEKELNKNIYRKLDEMKVLLQSQRSIMLIKTIEDTEHDMAKLKSEYEEDYV